MKIDCITVEAKVESDEIVVSGCKGYLGSFSMGSDEHGAKFIITFDENETQRVYQKEIPRSKGWAGLKRMFKCALFGHNEDMTLSWWMFFNKEWKQYHKEINYCFRCGTNFGVYENPVL